MAILSVLLFGMTLPITPVRILWANPFTVVVLGLAHGHSGGERLVRSAPCPFPAR